MAYKCNNCGHIFEEGEAATWNEFHGFTDGLCETFSGCPVCNGDYEGTTPCKECGSEKTEDELFHGFCKECLNKRLTKEVAVKYLVENGIVVDFAFPVLFDAETPKTINKTLLDFVIPFVEKNATMEQLKKYIFDDDCGVDHFAEWLSVSDFIEKGVK